MVVTLQITYPSVPEYRERNQQNVNDKATKASNRKRVGGMPYAMGDISIIHSDLRGKHWTKVARRTAHEDAISPVLWLIVMDEILQVRDRSRLKIVVYADDLMRSMAPLLPFVMKL